MLKIALVDDHQIVREGFKQLIELEPNMQVLAEFGSYEETVLSKDLGNIDVCIIDISLPDKNGLELAKALKSQFPSLSLIILSMYEQQHYVSEAISIGVVAYLSKRTASDTLIDALHNVASGNTFFSQDTLALLNADMQQDPMALMASLTTRERQVFDLMVKGTEVKKIALALDIAIKTAHAHRRNAMQKLNLKNSFEATQFALKNGFVDADSLCN